MCSLRVLSGFPRVEVRMRVAAFGLRSESISLACGSPAVRGAWWAASLETRCLGHRLTAFEALGCVMHALPLGNLYLSIYQATSIAGAGARAGTRVVR